MGTILMAAFTSTILPDSIYGTTNKLASTIETTHAIFQAVDMNFDGTFNAFISHVFAAGTEANETYTFRKMVKQEDRDQFVDTMVKEVDHHTRRDHWEIIP